MSRNISDIIKDVRVCMDEIGVNDSQFVGGADDSELDVIIKSKIGDAYNFVYEHADVDLLGTDALSMKSEAYKSDSNSITYDLGKDLLRVVQGKMSSWMKPVTDVVNESDAAYIMAFDEYVGATWDRPKMLMCKDYKSATENAVYMVTLVGKKNANDTGMVWYIPRLELSESDTSVDISDKIYRAVVYYCAGLTYLTFNDKSRAQELLEVALTMIGANNKE